MEEKHHEYKRSKRGIEFLRSHQDKIVDNLGTETYFRLHSVITQHHGEYGDRPRTIEAYIVHKADSLEAVMTQLEESLENSMNGDVIQQDGNLRVFLN